MSSYAINWMLISIIIISLMNCVSVPAIGYQTGEESSIGPQIVFLYPESLENGSNYWPGQYIYFTLGGNLSLIEFGDYVIYCNWNNELLHKIGALHNGIGVVPPDIIGEVTYNTWYTLTFQIYVVEGEYLPEETQTEYFVDTQVFSFFATPIIPYEPLSAIPVNYPNNSIVYDVHTFQGEYILLFEVSGFELDYQEVLAGTASSPKEVTFEHRWDNQTEWMNTSVNTYRLTGYSYIPFNYFAVAPYSFRDNGTHDLYIRLSNKTHSEIVHYRYTLIDINNVPEGWYIWNEDFFWRVGDIKPFLVSDTSYNITYNWNDGTGNHTISSEDWLAGWGGWAGHYNLTVPNFGVEKTGYGALTIWINEDPPVRYAFSYETIIPQVDLYYPLDDSPKLGMIPVVWSLRVSGRGTFNYSQYRFALYYETDSHAKDLALDDYNPLAESHYQDWYKTSISEYHLFKSKLNLELTGTDPMVAGYQFKISDYLSKNETEGLRFVINETTTNVAINASLRTVNKAIKNADPNTTPDPIKSGISEWLVILYSDISPNPFGPAFPTPISIISFFAAIAALILFKRKRKGH
ncbi:MAG: hypothetical protein ACFFCZ_11475 [Promethearchaeota archaeon]